MRHLFIMMGGLGAMLAWDAPARAQTQRELLKRMIAEHLDESWPRGQGHVVLAWPGSRLDQKGYHEPGGSFSPAPGSFGIQLVVRDGQGQTAATSDGIALAKLKQNWVATDAQPGIETRTDFYTARWWPSEPGRFTLSLTPRLPEGNRMVVVLRAAGPAGGPIRSVRHKGFTVTVNERWDVTVAKNTEGVQVLASPEEDWNGAEVAVPPRGEWRLVLTDTRPAPPSPVPTLAAGPRVQLPDTRFAESIAAQLAHLRMSLTGDETRPGEPLNYPLAWLRDGAYTLAALASAGDLETARVLSKKFAESDYFGGFGPEADAPGLALWGLEEVAVRLRDPKHDQWLWPHTVRKAEMILAMRDAREPIRAVPAGPIVPKHANDPDLGLVCEAARDGLIVGRMDHHRPLLFVNAVSYRGLLAAAALATRVDDTLRAERWRAAAASIRTAWWKAFELAKERDNERTAISGMWPTWIAANDTPRFQPALREGMPEGQPLWTYFDFARAHQWLYLKQPEKAWPVLSWYWDHQASPGLYSWWEGKGEENSFGLWENVRGWVAPPHVTPHYWTAAEALLLQLEMLAYVDESAEAPELVIGAGVRKDWLKSPMEVRGLATRMGIVDWTWRAGKARVLLDGKTANARIAWR